MDQISNLALKSEYPVLLNPNDILPGEELPEVEDECIYLGWIKLERSISQNPDEHERLNELGNNFSHSSQLLDSSIPSETRPLINELKLSKVLAETQILNEVTQDKVQIKETSSNEKDQSRAFPGSLRGDEKPVYKTTLVGNERDIDDAIMEEDEDGIGEFSVQDQEDPQILSLLDGSSGKKSNSSYPKQSKEGQNTSSTDLPAEQIQLSMNSSGQGSRFNFNRNDLLINISGTLPDESIKPIKKTTKSGRKTLLNNYKTISFEISHMKELKKDKFKASGNMSPRMNEHKNRRVVHKIVDIQMYRDKNTAEDYDEKFQKINSKEKTEEDVKKLTEILRRHFIFFSLDDSQLKKVIEEMIYCFSPNGVDIIPQGSMASFFFVLDEGEVSILINGEHKRTLVAGQFFGDLALLYNSRRSATVKATTDCKMWGITRDAFRNQIKKLKTEQYKENRDMLNKVNLFAKLTNSQKDTLAAEMIMSHHRSGEVIFSQGDDANALFIVKKGIVDVIKDLETIASVAEGAFFGENALLESTKAKRSATIAARTEVVCLSLPRQLLMEIFGQDVQSISLTNFARASLRKSPVLSKFTRTQQERIINEMKITCIEAGENLFEKDLDYFKVILYLEGTLVTYNDNDSTEVCNQLEFGSEELVEHQPFRTNFTIKAESKVWYAELDMKWINTQFGDDLKGLFIDNLSSHEAIIKRHRQIQVSLLDFEDIKLFKYLGAGSYGAVHLVQNMKDNHMLALKSISKKLINNQTALQLLKNEKEILSFIEFPLVINMEAMHKEEKYIHFFIEFVDGLPFDDVLMKLDTLSEWQTCFYTSQVILMLDYLHCHGIVYRDLKAQNIICSTDGYLKLVDLGTAKFLSQSSDGCFERTFTVVGTPHYTAPEIIQQKGYSFPADYWSLGILLYEVALGSVPFGCDESDVFQVYQEILKGDLEFPEWFDWDLSKEVLLLLLNKSPDARVNGNISSLKVHKWFELINWDWDKLLNKKIEPNFKPDSVIEEESLEVTEPENIHKIIDDACRPLTAIKSFKSNLPEDWDNSF